MRRTFATLTAWVAVAGVVLAFVFPTEFAWSGWNTFATCVATAGYASDMGSRFAWLGFAACVLYPPVWAVSAAVAVTSGRPSAVWLPAAATVAGSVMVFALGVLLLARRETWPAVPVQWLATAASPVHGLAVWFAARHAAPRGTVLIGGIPFVLAYAGLVVESARYGAPVAGFAAALVSLLVLLAAAATRPSSNR
jgi:hypothetical protein